MPETADTGLIARTETRDLGQAPALAAASLDDPFARPARQARRRRYRGWYRLISPVAVVLLWQLLSSAGLIPAQKLPPPTAIWHTAATLVTTNSPAYGTLQDAMLVSLERMAVGFAIGGTVAVLLALVAGLSRLGENGDRPAAAGPADAPAARPDPGVHRLVRDRRAAEDASVIALGAAIPMYLNTFAGIRSVDAKLAEVGQVLRPQQERDDPARHPARCAAAGADRPAAEPRRGLARPGRGRTGQRQRRPRLHDQPGQQFLRNDVILVALAVYAVLGLITDALVRLLERRALAWRRGLLE